MNSSFSNLQLGCYALKGGLAMSAVAMIVLMVVYLRGFAVSDPPPSGDSISIPEVPLQVLFDDVAWEVLRHPHAAAPVQDLGPLARRFRLAGTFFAFTDSDAPRSDEARRAILDDLSAGRQHLVREGDRMGEVDVVAIKREYIVLRDDRGEERLYLSFQELAMPATTRVEQEEAAATPFVPLRFEDMPTLEENRFGRRIADNRWIMSRDALIEYADEIQDEPERLTALLMAMQPDFDDADQIQGFVLEMLGEDLLYEAAGFQEGDIVRQVNSMPMTSPARAGYFIRELLQGNISALVFDIERDGRDQKLIYLVR